MSSRVKQLDDATNTKKKLQGQIVNSPERFRKQIRDSAEALQQEQNEMRTLERKYRELNLWLVQLDEASSCAHAALECMQEVKAEVDNQKECIAMHDEQKEVLSSRREALKAINQNLQQLNRQSTKAEDKLSSIRRLADSRGADTQTALESLHTQLIEAEEWRAKAKLRAEKAEADALRMENEVDNDSHVYEEVNIACRRYYLL